jgi:hypothetical protein
MARERTPKNLTVTIRLTPRELKQLNIILELFPKDMRSTIIRRSIELGAITLNKQFKKTGEVDMGDMTLKPKMPSK